MKRQEEELRKALSEIAHATHGLPCDGAPDAILSRIRGIATTALNATATPEMERLLEWLAERRKHYHDLTEEARADGYTIAHDYNQRRWAFNFVLTHIRAEHGYGEER